MKRTNVYIDKSLAYIVMR